MLVVLLFRQRQEMAYECRWRESGDGRSAVGKSGADSLYRHRQRRIHLRRSPRRQFRCRGQNRLSSAPWRFRLHDPGRGKVLDQHQQSQDVSSLISQQDDA